VGGPGDEEIGAKRGKHFDNRISGIIDGNVLIYKKFFPVKKLTSRFFIFPKIASI
jgi:hypothetical protein